MERIAAKRSKYQTINPENHASGHCRRIKIAHISAGALSNEKERTRVTIPVVTARHNWAAVSFMLALSTLCADVAVATKAISQVCASHSPFPSQ